MGQPRYGHKLPRHISLTPWILLSAGIVWVLVVFGWTTGRIGALYGFAAGLGPKLHIGTVLLYSPLTALRWPEELWHTPEVNRLVVQGVLAFGAPVFLMVALFVKSRSPRAVEDLYGTARWANRKDIEEMGYLGGCGVYVGGYLDGRRTLYLRHNGPEHIMCFAPTRSGKGVGLILPTLLSWPGSSLVLDIKGENWALTSGWRQSQGQLVMRFDPSDQKDSAARYNPLEEVRLDSGRAIADVQQLATMILDPDGKGLSDYWEKAAFGFFAASILHCMIMQRSEHGRSANLMDVSVMLEDHDRSGGPSALFKEMLEADHAALLRELFPGIDADLPAAAHIFIAAGAAGMLAKASKEMSGVVSQATANMSLYRDPIVARNTACCDFRIHDLMKAEKPISLYLVVSPADIDRTRPLFRIFVSQLCGRLMEEMEFDGGGTKATYRHRLLLMLDEFTSLGKLAIVERAIAYMAGYGIKSYIIVQDTKQLNKEYGADNALMANCHVRIAYAPNVVETAELLSKMTGTTTVVQRKENINTGRTGGGSLSVAEVSRPLLTPDECMRLPGIKKMQRHWWQLLTRPRTWIQPGEMLIFTAGNYPVYGRQILHFLDPTFLTRARMSPPVLSDSLYFKRTAAMPAPPEQPGASKEAASAVYVRYLDDLPAHVEGR